jgi:hypothetical protein
MLVYNVGAAIVSSDNWFYMLRAITVRSDNYSIEYKSVMRKRQIVTYRYRYNDITLKVPTSAIG